jgi:hypothetical protein
MAALARAKARCLPGAVAPWGGNSVLEESGTFGALLAPSSPCLLWVLAGPPARGRQTATRVEVNLIRLGRQRALFVHRQGGLQRVWPTSRPTWATVPTNDSIIACDGRPGSGERRGGAAVLEMGGTHTLRLYAGLTACDRRSAPRSGGGRGADLALRVRSPPVEAAGEVERKGVSGSQLSAYCICVSPGTAAQNRPAGQSRPGAMRSKPSGARTSWNAARRRACRSASW